MNKYIKICIDNEREYLNNDFINYIKKRNIRFEFITTENLQMNDCVEHLNQTLMRKTNTFFKNNNLHFKWWYELINVINHLRNICSITNLINNNKKSIISYETFIDHLYNYNTLRKIDQKKYQIIKSSTSYKKFDDHKISNVLINYESKHIYKIIIETKKLKRCFNVEWYDNFNKTLFQISQSSSQTLQSSFQTTQSTQSSFEINQIDQFLNAFFNEMNDERLKLNSTFKQFAFRTTQNSTVIISQVSDRSQYITFFTFSTNNYTFSINDFLTFSSNLNSNVDVFTSTLIDELIIDFILQKTKFFNSIDIKQKAFDRHSKF